jgi:hypothetical protein
MHMHCLFPIHSPLVCYQSFSIIISGCSRYVGKSFGIWDWRLVGRLLKCFIVIFLIWNSTIVSTAIPKIGSDFQALEKASWIVTVSLCRSHEPGKISYGSAKNKSNIITLYRHTSCRLTHFKQVLPIFLVCRRQIGD